ncbi:DUF2359 domain-containing protein [Cephalotus follicularis]|uniref:DUF2359 domain-containing protein n=1 Tax=Cephalotus follicularis TaxID=3775 RepID=A0A1Q3B5Y9_CEPFO|nr:DUF2359 domain-containing protein [Cephalotus follicularis]
MEAADSSLKEAPTDHGWQKVIYPKRQRKTKPNASDSNTIPNKLNGILTNADKPNVFRSIEQQSEDRRRKILEAERSAAAASNAPVKPKQKRWGDEENEDSSDAEIEQNGKPDEAKKLKPKKQKKPKVTVAEAAAKIDADDLAAFLADVLGSYGEQQEIQMMRFADYFGRAFSAVGAAQFPWTKMLRESSVAKIVDIPLSHISDVVYKTSVDWINQRSSDALGSFVLWSLDSILLDLANQQTSAKGSKKGMKQVSLKSQVAIFVVIAMVLRRKPDVLINVLPTLRENPKYQGQDKLPVLVWMMAQASQGDLAVGLYTWAHGLLPIVTGKNCNPQSRDLILQLVERILSTPKAKSILVNSAVRKGERLIPPSALESLMWVTFSASPARVKATERFEAIYPTLKEVALAGSPGSKAMKQVSQQILSLSIKAAGDSTAELSKEAADICIWCLIQNADCYKQWDKVYHDNIEASVAVLKKLSEEWKQQFIKLFPLDPLRETLKSFRVKNEKAMASEADAANQSHFRDADKYCKLILGGLSHGHACMKTMAFFVIALAVGAAVMSPKLESWDWKKLSTAFNFQNPF